MQLAGHLQVTDCKDNLLINLYLELIKIVFRNTQYLLCTGRFFSGASLDSGSNGSSPFAALPLSACEAGQSLWGSINNKKYLREDKKSSQTNSLIQGPGNFFLYNENIKTM